jgi:hypothetical protein
MHENYYSQKATHFNNCDPFRIGQKSEIKNATTPQNYDPFKLR